MADERMSEEEIDCIARTFGEQSIVDGSLARRAVAELRRERARADEAAKCEREAIVARLRAIPVGDMRAVGMQADEYHEAERELFIAVAEGRDHG